MNNSNEVYHILGGGPMMWIGLFNLPLQKQTQTSLLTGVIRTAGQLIGCYTSQLFSQGLLQTTIKAL